MCFVDLELHTHANQWKNEATAVLSGLSGSASLGLAPRDLPIPGELHLTVPSEPNQFVAGERSV